MNVIVMQIKSADKIEYIFNFLLFSGFFYAWNAISAYKFGSLVNKLRFTTIYLKFNGFTE